MNTYHLNPQTKRDQQEIKPPRKTTQREKSKGKMNHPGGPGPWFVALLFNTNARDKKQSELVSHTYPHFVVDFLNKNAPANAPWILFMKIGPCESWHQSLAFLESWSHKARSKTARIERGIQLWQEHQDDITLWIEARQKNEAIRCKKEKKTFRENMPIYDIKQLTQ
jgi:hypothetical protein